MRRKLLLIVAAMAMLLGACASVSTDSDKAAVAYTDGPMEGVKFDKVVGPGSGLVWLGLGDKSYQYPTTTRTYIVSDDPAEGERAFADVIEATTKDGGTIDWEVAVYFKLNLTLLRDFHENIGKKYSAWNDDGWSLMLEETLRQQLENALQTSSRKYTVDQYKKDPDVLRAVNSEIAKDLKDNVNEVLGNDYFCGPTFNALVTDKPTDTNCPDFEVVVKKPNFETSTDEAYNAEITKRKAVENAKLDNAKKLEDTEGAGQREIRAAELEHEAFTVLLQLIQQPGYLDYQELIALQECAKNDGCTLIVQQNADGTVNVNTGRR